MLPAWLPSPASLPGREDCVQEVESTLARAGACLVAGPPGSGTTSVAGRVAARSGRTVLACSFAGALDDADVSLLVGYTFGVPSPGDESSVRAALRNCAGALLVADEVTTTTWTALRALASLAPDLQLVGTCSARTLRLGGSWDGGGTADAAHRGVPVRDASPNPDAVAESVVRVPPLDVTLRTRLFPGVDTEALAACGAAENLLAARVCASGVAPPALAMRLGHAAWLAGWPMGVPDARTDDLPALCIVRDARRTRLRAGARALALDGRRPRRRGPQGRTSRGAATTARVVRPGRAAFHERGPWWARQWTEPRLREALAALLRVAEGAHLRRDPLPDDHFLLRAVGLRARERDVGVRALVAAARLAQALGAVPAARQLLRVARRRLGDRPGEDAHVEGLRARVAWAEGELLLSTGQASAALAARDEAGAAFIAARDPHGHAVMLRQAGDRALQRGEVWLADTAFTAAARLDANDEAITRASRAVARAIGGSCATTQDPSTLSPTPGSANWVTLRLEALARAVDAGEVDEAGALLSVLRGVAEYDRRVAATLLHRRAELSLRHDATLVADGRGAAELATDAADAWARLGERVAEGSAWRVAGDALAVRGDLADARAAYTRAIDRQLRAQDLRGLARTLARVAIVEEALGNPDEADRRRREVRAVQGLVGDR